MTTFTAKDAQLRTEKAIEHGTQNKGQIIDIIKDASDKGLYSVEVPNLNLSDDDANDFLSEGFKINKDIISWKA